MKINSYTQAAKAYYTVDRFTSSNRAIKREPLVRGNEAVEVSISAEARKLAAQMEQDQAEQAIGAQGINDQFTGEG